MSKGNIISVIILGGLAAFFVLRKIALVNNPIYTKGIIDKYSESGKGHHYINYLFVVDGIEYHGSMPTSFCWKTACGIGDTVIVRYRKNHPSQSDLVHQMPE